MARDESRGGGTQVAPNEVQKALGGIDYPARKRDLVEHAKSNDAPDAVVRIIERLPDREYGGPQEVMKAYGDVDHQV